MARSVSLRRIGVRGGTACSDVASIRQGTKVSESHGSKEALPIAVPWEAVRESLARTLSRHMAQVDGVWHSDAASALLYGDQTT
jgi:hypothetical protein